MIPQIPPVAVMAILWCAALAGIILSAVALFVTLRQHRAARLWAEAEHERLNRSWEKAAGGFAERLDAGIAEWREWKQQAARCTTEFAGSSGRTGLDLTRRAQALRMHRRGDSPEQIATILKVPHQEIDLLVKVHRMVMERI